MPAAGGIQVAHRRGACAEVKRTKANDDDATRSDCRPPIPSLGQGLLRDGPARIVIETRRVAPRTVRGWRGREDDCDLQRQN
jgi:hypothetical protein